LLFKTKAETPIPLKEKLKILIEIKAKRPPRDMPLRVNARVAELMQDRVEHLIKHGFSNSTVLDVVRNWHKMDMKPLIAIGPLDLDKTLNLLSPCVILTLHLHRLLLLFVNLC
jgi:hypothetical protein